jgi:hypothetical protein
VVLWQAEWQSQEILNGQTHDLRPVRRNCDARNLRLGKAESMVNFGVCRILLARVYLRVPAGRLALRVGRSDLGYSGSAAMVAVQTRKVADVLREKDMKSGIEIS